MLEKLKEQGQDFEWYPTTQSMIKVVYEDFIKQKLRYRSFFDSFSILDIGAGDGNVFRVIDELSVQDDRQKYIKKFAIEKSEILINAISEDVVVLGTDFHQQTLIDKKVDIIFCNPPYSEYEVWVERIVKEANADYVYMIIPERWKDHEGINAIIKRRDIEFEILAEDDFLDSEYRKARAKINIVRFCLSSGYNNDAFSVWFDEHFSISAQKENTVFTSKSKDGVHNRLVKGKNLVESLEELYLADFENLLNTYKKLEEVDARLLKELGIDIGNVKTGLKEKIKGLKLIYWQELFDNFSKITDRLTSKSRERLLKKFMDNTSVDFTCSNAYAVILWVLKKANIYIDEQLKEVFFEMCSKENIVNYKSNTHFPSGKWRYNFREMTHFKLDYRLVFQRHSNFSNYSYLRYDYPNNLNKTTHDFLNDICTVGKNLGFNVITSSFDFEWSPNSEKTFYYTKDGKQEIFMKVRAYLNGNIHCKPSQEFIKKLNIEMGRLTGWVHSAEEASKEMDIPINDALEFFKSNKKLLREDTGILQIEA